MRYVSVGIDSLLVKCRLLMNEVPLSEDGFACTVREHSNRMDRFLLRWFQLTSGNVRSDLVYSIRMIEKTRLVPHRDGAE